MAMAKPPQAIVDRFEQLRPAAEAGVTHRQMFGAPCSFVNGQMFMGLYEDRLFLRLSEADRAAFLALPGAEQFAPMAGRPMREYVTAPPAMLADQITLGDWVARSLSYAATLPLKEKKPRAAKRPKAATRP